jgi:hypothetical protein
MLSLKPVKVSLIGSPVLLLSLSLLPFAASAQSQGDNASVADAARRAREQKKAAAKPARTLTNDDLPAAPAVRAQSAVAPTDAAEPANADQTKSEGESAVPAKTPAPAEPNAQGYIPAKKPAETEAALKRAKAELAQVQNEFDVLQRQAALDSDSYYSKTDYVRDTEGKAKLDADAQQVKDKKARVDDLKARVAALQAELGETAESDKPAQPR